MQKSAVFCLLIFITVAGCKNVDSNAIVDVPVEYNLEPIILFCPEDGCGKNLEFLLNSAKGSVHCAFFDLDLKNIINVLAKKSHDVEVKIVIDDRNYEGQIKGNVKVDNGNQLMHNKFCIIDNKAVWTGSFNPTENGDRKNNNNVIVFYSKLIAKNYEDEFYELWDGNFGRGEKVKNPVVYLNNKKIENYFCPEDDCEKHVIENIRKAKESIYFMAFSFTSENVADSILFNENAEIKGVVEARNANSQGSQYQRLKDFGIDIIKDKNGFSMHHKVFIIDRKIVVTGSYNPTIAGNKRNDENLIIIHGKKTAEKYMEEFEKIFYS